MTKRQYVVAVVASIIVILFSLMLFKVFSGMKKEVTPKRPPVIARKVQSSLVRYKNIEASVFASGRVVSQQSVDVISEVQGKILPGDIVLRKGSSFTQGQALVRIYKTDTEYALQAKKSLFLNSLASILPDIKIDYKESYQKWIDFFESIDIKKDLPPLPEAATSQERIFLSSRAILSDYYSIKASEVQLKKYTIYAPFSGAIESVTLEPGSVVNPGSRIASIIRTNQLEIEVPLEVDEAVWVNIGQGAKIINDKGQLIGKGKVVRKSNFVDASNQSINVFVKILPGSEKVFSGQYLKVEFDGMRIKNAMELPRNAVFNRNMVYVVEGGYLVKREIEVIKTNEKSLFFDGLDVGVEVVTQPLTGINANTPVQTEYTRPLEKGIQSDDSTEAEISH